MHRFEEGLQQGIQKLLSSVESKDYHETYRRSIRIDSEMTRRGEVLQAKKQKTFENKTKGNIILSSSNQCDKHYDNSNHKERDEMEVSYL